MPLFTTAIRTQALGGHVIASLFVLFDFLTTPIRVWEGDGPLDREGHTWRGMGSRVDGQGNPLQSIDGLEAAVNGQAPQLNLTLSGVDATVVAAARDDADAGEIEGRDLTVFIGFFDATIPWDLIPLDSLIPLGTWIMGRPSFTATGPTVRAITLPCESLFTQRSRAPFGLLTDRDNQRRFPGDRGCEFPPKLVDRDVAWPRH